MKIILFFLAALGFTSTVYACNNLEEQLSHDEPIVKAKLLALNPGERLSGIPLCDSTTAFAGWRYLRPAKVQARFQHILLFKAEHAIQAVAWVEPQGQALLVPACPHGKRCSSLPEAATVISGDIHTFKSVLPAGNLVILRYPPASW